MSESNAQVRETKPFDMAAALLALAEAPRRHPDLFTDQEAATYLHLSSVRSLETCREKYGLVAFRGPRDGGGFMYWREDLDNCALRIVGRNKEQENVQPSGHLRIAGRRA